MKVPESKERWRMTGSGEGRVNRCMVDRVVNIEVVWWGHTRLRG